MKIKIISNGNPVETRVENAETGERIEGVVSIDWHLDVTGSKLVLALEEYEIEHEISLDGEGFEMEETDPGFETLLAAAFGDGDPGDEHE